MEEIFNEMHYSYSTSAELLAKGEHDGHEFCILSYGSHPCSYVKLNEDDVDYDIEDYTCMVDIDCHGGLTFCETYDGTDEFRSPGKWIGWDYAHAGDKIGIYCSGKAYTTRELVEDAKSAICTLKRK